METVGLRERLDVSGAYFAGHWPYIKVPNEVLLLKKPLPSILIEANPILS